MNHPIQRLPKNYQGMAVYVATGLGVGFSPMAPGSVASLVMALMLWPFGPYLADYALVYAALTLGMTALGLLSAHAASPYLGAHDDGRIVIDEWAGMMVAYGAFALGWLPWSLPMALLGLGLFRLLDILKPFPIGLLDRAVPGAWGVMLDDLAAGALAALALWGLSSLGPWA